MAWVGSTITTQVVSLLTGPQGLGACLTTLMEAEQTSLAQVGPSQVLAQNVSADIAERSTNVAYPAVYVYCEKILNQLIEKFRTFSGKAVMVVEVRVSQDRLEGLETLVQSYVDAITQVLDQSRGDWNEGVYYAGGYEVVFGTVKHGGRNLMQVAKVTFEVGVSN